MATGLGAAATALGWEGAVVIRGEDASSQAQSLIARFAEDVQAAGAALATLGAAIDAHAPALRRIQGDWDALQADPPTESWIGPSGFDRPRVDHEEWRRLERELISEAESHMAELSSADGSCLTRLREVAHSVGQLVPAGASPDFTGSLMPQGTTGFFIGHGLRDDPGQLRIAAELDHHSSPQEVRDALRSMAPEQLDVFLARHPEIAGILARDWDNAAPGDAGLAGLLAAVGPAGAHGPEVAGVAEVQRYWGSLSRVDRDRLVLLHPTLVGNTDGIPLVDRARANRALIGEALREEIAVEAVLAAGPTTAEQLEQRVAGMEKSWLIGLFVDQEQVLRDGYWALRSENGQLIRRTEHPDMLLAESRRRIELYQQVLTGTPAVLREDIEGLPGDQRMVIAFDPRGDGMFAEYSGRLDAPNVGVLVPGTGNDLASMQDYNRRFSSIAEYSRGDTAVITWLGSDMPDAVAEATRSEYSEASGHRLVRFVEGLDLGEDRHASLVGHSAGGSAVGFADALGVDVDSVLHVASAGTGPGISNASLYPSTTWDRHPRQVDRFAQTAPGDAIQVAQSSGEIDELLVEHDWPDLPEGVGHGYDPEETPGFTELDPGVWLQDDPEAVGGPVVEGQRLEGFYAHDHVIRQGTTSWDNIVAVIRQDEDEMAFTEGEE